MSSQQPSVEELTLPVKRTDGETLRERLTANAYENILPARYLRRDADGTVVEDQEELFARVASNIALAEAVYEAERRGVEIPVTPDQLKPDHPRRDELAREVFGPGVTADDDAEAVLTEHNVNKFSYGTVVPALPEGLREHVEGVGDEFRSLMERLAFVPNSPTLMNAGDELQQLSACFVDSPGDDITDIHETAKEAAEVFQCLTEDARVCVGGKGIVSIDDVEPGDEIRQRDGDGYRLQTVAETHAYRDAPTRRVVTEAGVELTGTPNHELLVDDEWTRIDEISPGGSLSIRLDWLTESDGSTELETVPAGGQWAANRAVTNDEILDLYRDGYSDYEMAERLDCSASTVQRRRANELGLPANGSGGRPRGSVSFDADEFDRLYEAGHTDGEIAERLGVHETSVGQYRASRSLGPNELPAKSVTQPTTLTTELAELLGMWVGDGSTHEDGIRFHLRREETLEHADRLCRHLFDEGLDWRFDDGCYDAVLHSHEVRRFWLANFGDAKPDAPNAAVPGQLLAADRETVAAFLRGLFSTDGSLQKGLYPRLWSASSELVDGVQHLLLGLGIPAARWEMDSEEREYHNVGPTGEPGLRRYAEQVGFVDSREDELAGSLDDTEFRGTTFGTIRDGSTWEVPVERVEDAGTATVYDVTVEGNHEYLADGVVSHNSGGGMGYAFWRLRPYGDSVGSTGGIASGPITFMETFDQMCETIAQGGTRRGAQMAIMRVSHPDVVEFIHAKNKDVSLAHSLRLNDPDDYTYTSFSEALAEARDLIDEDGRVPKHLRNAVEGHLSNFNISVGVTDEFMAALEAGEEYTFVNPRTGEAHVATEHTEEMYERYGLGEYVEVGEALSMPAEVLWDRVVEGAWENGEPGVIYIDRVNDEHSFPVESTPTGDGSEYEILATNPCVAEGTLVNTPDGLRPVEEIAVGDEISTVIGSETVDEIEVHEEYDVYEVAFSDGGTMRVTAQHQFHVKQDGKKVEPVPLHRVEEGDYVRLHPSELGEDGTDEQYHHQLKRGILLGDGSYTDYQLDKHDRVKIATSSDDEAFNERVKELFGEDRFNAPDVATDSKSKSMLLTDGAGVVSELGLEPATSPEKSFDPTELATEAEVVGILDGLLATDGNVNLYSNHPQIRWDTSSAELADAIRNALLSVGIHGRVSVITDPKRGGTIDGRKVSANHPKYTVNVSGASARRYATRSRLGEVHPEKGQQLFELRTEWMTTGNTWKAKIESIEPVEEPATVYDLYCSESDTWITEGYVQRGCGEQPLMEYEACNLGHINLSTIADMDAPDWRVWSEAHADEHDSLEAAVRAFLDEAVDVAEFDHRIEWGTRFLENVVTMSDFPVEEIEETVYRNRKIGLGVMGLAQLYVQLGLRYGSEPANEAARQLMRHINHGSKHTSHELAEARGSFANWDDSKYADPTEHREWFEHQTGLDADDWADGFAIRNHNTTTIAPTGTTSMVGNTTGGCEPIYNVAYYKNVSDDVQGEEMLVEFDDYFLRTLEANDVDVAAVKAEATEQMAANEFDGVEGLETVPDAIGELFVVSSDIAAKEHAAVQCACQEGVDSAISKTCNFPHSATVAEMDEVYRYIFEHGGKGVTVYRDGTRSKQVLTTRADNAEFAEMDETEAAETLLARIEDVFGGVESFLAHDAVRAEVEGAVEGLVADAEGDGRATRYAEKRERPEVLNGVTQRIDTGYGKLYVTINEDPEHEEPFELFANTGYSGGFTNSFVDALAKTISIALRSGVDPREVVDKLEGIRSPKVAWDKGEQINSIPDAFGTALRRYLDDEVDKAYPQQQTLDETADEDPAAGVDAGTGPAPPESPEGGPSPGANPSPEAGPGPGEAEPQPAADTADATQSIIDAGESPECPECGAMSLYFAEGCKHCEACGWSEC